MMIKIKSICFTIILLFSSATQAQVAKLADIERLKTSTVIVGLPSDEALAKSFREAIESNWTFTEINSFLPLSEAKAKAKADESYLVIKIGSVTAKSLTHGSGVNTFRYVRKGYQLQIIGKKAKPILVTPIPAFGEEKIITTEILYFGVTSLQDMFVTMESKKMKTNMKLKSVYAEKTEEVNNKTLLLPGDWVDEKIKGEIGSLYKGKIEVTTYEEWADAILKKSSDYVYVMIAPVPAGENYVYVHYLVDAEKGFVYGMIYPKVAVSVKGNNVTKSNKGYLNEKILKKYNAAIFGK